MHRIDVSAFEDYVMVRFFHVGKNPHATGSIWPAALSMIAVAILSAIGCSSGPAPSPEVPPTQTPVPTLTPVPSPVESSPPSSTGAVVFPEDEGSHDTPIEWWYFNGMLRDEYGGEYSYHFVTFQSEWTGDGTPHLIQATLGDHRSGAHYHAETVALALPEATGVDIESGGWVMRGGPEGYDMHFQFSGPNGPVGLELSAVSQREPVLHGGSGLVEMGPEAGSTYYYSRTRLAVSGWIEDTGGRREVSGPGWMDHQWGDVTRRDIGWDWSSIQLDDGSDLMVAVIWHPEGHRRLAGHGTYLEPDGDVTHYDEDDISITPLGAWVSPETGIEYPSGWRIEVAPLGLELELTPFVEQAEFTSGFIRVSYWEGAVSVAGQRGGQSVTGWGFVELVGYDPKQLEATPTPQQQ